MEWLAILIPAGIASILLLVISAVRLDIYGKWHSRWGHKCGWHTEYRPRDGICPNCGERAYASDFTMNYARATWPWGWEYKASEEPPHDPA